MSIKEYFKYPSKAPFAWVLQSLLGFCLLVITSYFLLIVTYQRSLTLITDGVISIIFLLLVINQGSYNINKNNYTKKRIIITIVLGLFIVATSMVLISILFSILYVPPMLIQGPPGL